MPKSNPVAGLPISCVFPELQPIAEYFSDQAVSAPEYGATAYPLFQEFIHPGLPDTGYSNVNYLLIIYRTMRKTIYENVVVDAFKKETRKKKKLRVTHILQPIETLCAGKKK